MNKTSAATRYWSGLVTQITQMVYLSLKDPEKRTPLHAAAFLGDAEITGLLILSGKTCPGLCLNSNVIFTI